MLGCIALPSELVAKVPHVQRHDSVIPTANPVENNNTAPMIVALSTLVSLVVEVERSGDKSVAGTSGGIYPVAIQESLLMALNKAVSDSVEPVVN